jgi:hypothetical protein
VQLVVSLHFGSLAKPSLTHQYSFLQDLRQTVRNFLSQQEAKLAYVDDQINSNRKGAK